MDHLSELELADLIDGALSPEEEARVKKHIFGCPRCWEVSIVLYRHLRVPMQITLFRTADMHGQDQMPLAADPGDVHALSSTDRSVLIRFRRSRQGGPLQAYLFAEKQMLARGPKLVLPKHADGFAFRSDGTVELPGVEVEELSEGVLEFRLEPVKE